MKWTTKKPNKPGYYWVYFANEETPLRQLSIIHLYWEEEYNHKTGKYYIGKNPKLTGDWMGSDEGITISKHKQYVDVLDREYIIYYGPIPKPKLPPKELIKNCGCKHIWKEFEPKSKYYYGHCSKCGELQRTDEKNTCKHMWRAINSTHSQCIKCKEIPT